MTADPWLGATTIPTLPCEDVDALADFWTDLGFEVTHRELRPDPVVVVRRGAVELRYDGRPATAPQQGLASCVVLVDDVAAVYASLGAGMRERYGRIPRDGAPRLTRPRRRAHVGGPTGFGLVDPAGNRLRFVHRRGAHVHGPWAATTGDRPADPLTSALDDAAVHADSHGDPLHARRILVDALSRTAEASDADRVRALAFLAELAARTGDPEAAEGWLDDLADASARLDETTTRDVVDALDQADEVRWDLAQG